MSEDLKDLIWSVAWLVYSRQGDVSTIDGQMATVDIDTLLNIESIVLKITEAESDDISYEVLTQIRNKLNS